MTGLPRLPFKLLSWRLGPEWRDFVLGDLEEGFHQRAGLGRRHAQWWLWHQTLRCLIAPPRTVPVRTHTSSRKPMLMPTLWADCRYALRTLRHAPAFSSAVVVVLALAIGATAAIFSIVNAVLLRPMPFANPDRLVRVFHIPPQSAFPGTPTFPVSVGNYYDWKQSARSFDAMAIYRFRPLTLTGSGEAEMVVAGAVGRDFFEVIGTAPAIGRAFLPEEDAPGRSHVVVLSDGFWTRRFARDTQILGRALTLNGEAYTIVGVMPPEFTVTSWAITARDLWVPVAYSDADRAVRENHNAQVVARLRPGVDRASANADMAAISARLAEAYPAANAGWGATVIPLQELIVGDIRRTLVMLLAAVGLVLLIACANVGNLLFARSLGRRKEIALRAALGAGRARVFQQLIVEALVLAVTGGAAGLLMAQMALRAGAALLADQIPRADEISLDGRVLVFVAGVSLFAGIVAGLVPAIRAGRTDLNEALKDGGRAGGVLGLKTRYSLIVCEVALSVVLLMSAGVMLRSLVALRHVDAGINPHHVLTMQVTLPASRYDTPQRISAFHAEAVARLRALPGVQAVGTIDDLPTQGGSVQPVVLEGRAELSPRDQPTTEVRKISPGYLSAMQLPLLRGRDVQAPDEQVVLVSAGAARLLWGTGDPIGQRITLPLQSRTITKRVIGIVGDVKQDVLSQPAAPTIYEYTRDAGWAQRVFVLRTAGPPERLGQMAAGVIRAIDPQQPVQAIQTMDAVLDQTLGSQRLGAVLLGAFAIVALLLSSVGIYSVLSYVVRGRTREIGIRSALGARTSDVLRMILLEGMKPALTGIVVGAIAALGSTRLLQQLVFGVSASDPATLALVIAGLAVVAVAASLAPAYRAARVDPCQTLRG